MDIEEIISEFCGHGIYSSGNSREEILADLEGAELIIAEYDYGNWEGSAFILYEKGGKLFEVNGSHCSCYGLEGQWNPEETSWAALKMRKFYYPESISEEDIAREAAKRGE